MIDHTGWWPKTARALVLLGLGCGLTGVRGTAMGQDANNGGSTRAIETLVVQLKTSCESTTALRGARIQHGELKDGTLALTGTIDRVEQAGLIETEARRLLEANPASKLEVPGGVSAGGMALFPVRRDLLRQLQSDLARANIDPKARPTVLQQTRVDELYFDVRGRLQVAGVCINQSAYLAHKNAAANPGNNPLTPILRGIRDQLTRYPIPVGVDPRILGNIQTNQIAFEESPVRRLQRWANELNLDNVLFRDARFDPDGSMKVDGLLGEESERAQVAALLSRPEFVKAYARPGGKPPAEPGAGVGPMIVVTWRTTLLAELQKRFAGMNRKSPMADLRYCRLDRAFFVYPDREGLLLRFEGVAWRDRDGGQVPITAGVLRESSRLFVPPIRVDKGVKADLIRLPNPVGPLREKVAASPALDGARLDDLTFGPTGRATFEGLWIGPAQQPALEAALLPALAEQTRGKVTGPLEWRMNDFATDRLLRDLRGKVAAAFDKTSETSLDRLYFQPAAAPGQVPTLVLQGATIGARLDEVEAGLTVWLKASELMKTVSVPELRFAKRPIRLVPEIRKLVAADRNLDGVRVVQGVFDEENRFVLAGEQDHEGQAERIVELARKAAATAWPDLPPPTDIRVEAFTIRPLRTVLANLNRKLPDYPEADRVMLVRAYYDADSSLVLAGRTTAPEGDRRALTARIESLIDMSPRPAVKLSLTPETIDRDVTDRIIAHAINALAGGNIATFKREDLDEAIFSNPSNSTAWFLRAAYYLVTNDEQLAIRDLRRVRLLEKAGGGAERNIALARFQSEFRKKLEDMLESVKTKL